MTSSFSISNHLVRLREELNLILTQLERQLQGLNESSTEALEQLRLGFKERFEEWQRTIKRSRDQIAELPREFCHGEMVKNIKQVLEGCESHIRSLQLHPALKKLLERSKVFASKTQLQWGRKIFHTFNGLFALWLYAYSGLSEFGFQIVIVSFVSVAVVTEVTRRFSKRFNDWVCRLMGGMMRERERGQITAATWYMGSMMVVFFFFPREIFILTMLYVAVGDTAAGVVGSQWGRHRLLPHVSLEGSLAAFAACFLLTLLFTPRGLGEFHLSGFPLLWFSLLGGLIGAIAEGIYKKWDDNLVIPLVSAPSLWFLCLLFRH